MGVAGKMRGTPAGTGWSGLVLPAGAWAAPHPPCNPPPPPLRPPAAHRHPQHAEVAQAAAQRLALLVHRMVHMVAVGQQPQVSQEAVAGVGDARQHPQGAQEAQKPPGQVGGDERRQHGGGEGQRRRHHRRLVVGACLLC